ncbi:MAG: nucleotide exchange factor GrpE [Ruminococcaceae bacterium]|nr:nucleotide exchange factor GrpE [Oscillospiraceae bacterium]
MAEIVNGKMMNEAEEEVSEKVIEPEAQVSEEKPKKTKKKDDKKEAALKKEIEELNAQLAEQKDTYLRVMAEYENFRRRAQKEREGAYTDAYVDAIKEILPVIDNLERATAFSDNDKVSEGVALTLNQFKATLERMGVTEIEAEKGTKFDPNFHNAMMHVDDEALGENEISSVLQKGYVKGEKVIRYSMVIVAN